MSQPTIIIIAGPNGAGKTTFAREFLPHEATCPVFINADLIAHGIAPFRPESAALRAGKIMLDMMNDFVRHRVSFAFETTMSGRGYAKLIPAWKAMGYRIVIFFLELPTVTLAIVRVRNRVVQGGHDIPETVIRRRFTAGKRNFSTIYKPLADEWRLYDNSNSKPILMESNAANENKNMD